jgi:hypothetical protein
MSRVSKEGAVALAVSVLVIAEMAVDHLIGTEDEPGDESGLADPAAFVLSVLLSLALLAVLFGVVVRRARADPDDAARKALASSVLAVPALALLFLGLPLPFAAAGIALGLRGRDGRRRRVATAAVAIGALVVALTAAAYVAALVA